MSSPFDSGSLKTWTRHTMAVADDTFTIKIGIKNPVYAIISKCDENSSQI
jgi:hypothetical protein